MTKPKSQDTDRKRDDALKRALSTPPKPHKAPKEAALPKEKRRRPHV